MAGTDLEFESHLSAWLLLQPALADIIGLGLFPSHAPQTRKPPYVVYNVISDSRWGTLESLDGVSFTRIQFDCFGIDPKQTRRIGKTIESLVDAFRQGTMEGMYIHKIQFDTLMDVDEEPLNATEFKRYKRSVDVLAWFEEWSE